MRSDDEGIGEDSLWIGPVGPINVSDKPTPRRIAAAAGAARAQKLLTIDEHLDVLRAEPDEWVRYEVVPRLEARGRDDARTVPALIDALANDPSAAVRDAAAMALVGHVDKEGVPDALTHALADEDPDVRWSAAYALSQGAG